MRTQQLRHPVGRPLCALLGGLCPPTSRSGTERMGPRSQEATTAAIGPRRAMHRRSRRVHHPAFERARVHFAGCRIQRWCRRLRLPSSTRSASVNDHSLRAEMGGGGGFHVEALDMFPQRTTVRQQGRAERAGNLLREQRTRVRSVSPKTAV